MEEAAATVIPRHEPFIKSLNFKSTPQEPVTEWLTCYEHVASVSTWDGNAKVKFLNLALEGDAKKWSATQILTGTPIPWKHGLLELKFVQTISTQL